MKPKPILLSWLLLSIVVLSGCWNSKELSHLAIVSAIGMDKLPGGSEYRISFQVINPSEISSGIQGGGGGRTTAVTVIADNGSTLFEVIRKTTRKVPRELLFSHVKVLVIGEALARDGINELFDTFERLHQTRLTTKVVIARNTSAEDILGVITPMEKIPADAIEGKLEFSSKLWSENLEYTIDDIIRALVSKGREPVISGVIVQGEIERGRKKSNVEMTRPDALIMVRGLAMFKDGKMVQWLDGDKARGVIKLLGKIKSSVEELDCGSKKDAVTVELTKSKSRIKTSMHNGKPLLEISIIEEGGLVDTKCALDLARMDELAMLEQRWSKRSAEVVTASIEAAQKQKSDIFGFGEALNRTNKMEWKRVQNDWNTLFAKGEIHVVVDSYIRNSGMRIKSFLQQS